MQRKESLDELIDSATEDIKAEIEINGTTYLDLHLREFAQKILHEVELEAARRYVPWDASKDGSEQSVAG